jgi:hypothetical protein
MGSTERPSTPGSPRLTQRRLPGPPGAPVRFEVAPLRNLPGPAETMTLNSLICKHFR